MIKIKKMSAIIKDKPFDDLITFLRGIKGEIVQGTIVLNIDDSTKLAMYDDNTFGLPNRKVSITFELPSDGKALESLVKAKR